MSLWKRVLAEFIGTFWLVFGGCGTALISAKFPGVGVGYLGVALAFGLTLVTGIYALGAVSGGHFNPSVTMGLAVAGRFPAREIIPYWLAQVVGAIVAALVLFLVASGAPGFDLHASGFAANGYGAHSPGLYSLWACLLTEVVTTFMFLVVILGSTAIIAFKGFGPIAIGLALTLVHLVSIPVTNASVNPARSTGPAVFEGGWALDQLWLFWVAPLVGAALAGIAYPGLTGEKPRGEAAPLEEEAAEVLPPRQPAPAR